VRAVSRRSCPQYGKLGVVTSVGRDEDLRTRLRELVVFEGDFPDFDVSAAPTHPAELFLRWLSEAIDANVREPHAMTLSTVDREGRPSSRVLILKGLGDGRWEFATSRRSRKGVELGEVGWAALNFYWSELGRQVRVRGRVLEAGADRAAADFLARSDTARAGVLAGIQSSALDDPADLEDALREAGEMLERDPQAVDEQWAVYGLVPDEVEFWQAHPERRHVRLRYRLREDSWEQTRLWP
jgi:pyridoxamine 5'-phosphate oxidase